MSVLVVGGDRIDGIKDALEKKLGFDEVFHNPGRKQKNIKNGIPQNIDLVVMLVDYVNHDLMKAYKNIAKKRKLPFIYTHSVSHFKECLDSIAKCNCFVA
jgi:hypothetical protein